MPSPPDVKRLSTSESEGSSPNSRLSGRGSRLPPRWGWLFHRFQRYSERYLSRHFHAIRLSKSSPPLPSGEEPLLVVLNHPSWWDPMIGMALAPLFKNYVQYAAIHAEAVAKYRFFQRIGFVGVDASSLRGAAEFLRVGQAILAEPRRAFWVTAQGRFTDVRERPLALRSGVGHLASRLERGLVLPIAIEYSFWNERTPEALVRFGDPLAISDHRHLNGKAWTALIEASLTKALDVLNTETMSREPSRFQTIIKGRTGIGGMYDLWRRTMSWARGRRFDPSHGDDEENGR